MPDNLKDLKRFSTELARLRTERGIAKREMALKCGVSYKHYFNIEQGESGPSFWVYLAICRTLGAGRIPLVDKVAA